MKTLHLYARSLRHHPGWWVTAIYMAMPISYEAIHSAGDFNWPRVAVGTAAAALLTLIPVLWTAWTDRKTYDDTK